jgi:hypothetical protein
VAQMHTVAIQQQDGRQHLRRLRFDQPRQRVQ